MRCWRCGNLLVLPDLRPAGEPPIIGQTVTTVYTQCGRCKAVHQIKTTMTADSTA